jgi:predicted SAM-dependent methyltransferase
MTILNLACGNDYREDHINIDDNSQGNFKVDKKADVKKLKWKDNSVDRILVIHYVMYLTPPELDNLLKRWYGWLKKEGTIVIETGNIYSICKRIMQAKTISELHGKDCIRQLFGWENTHGHKWVWSPITIQDALERAGFKTGLYKGYFHDNPGRDFVIIGVKV